jgi:hypothetical protein
MLHELFLYIIEEPDKSQRLLEKLKEAREAKPKVIERLMF